MNERDAAWITALPEGEARLYYPPSLSAESEAELVEWLALVLTTLRRRSYKRSMQMASTDPEIVAEKGRQP